MSRVRLALILLSLPLVAAAEGPVTIDFDDLSAPCDIGSAYPLRNEYLALGVEFQGSGVDGAVVLHECSGLGVTGYSAPNYAVIDPQAVHAAGGTPDVLAFGFTGAAPRRVRALVGGPPGTTVYLGCAICPWAIPGCGVIENVTVGSGMTPVEVSTDFGFALGCEVYTNDPVGQWIVDDLELDFEQPATPVPQLSAGAAAVLVALVAVLGALAARRVA